MKRNHCQIRDVPDEVHDALVEAAQPEGFSLTRYLLRELEYLAKRGQIVQHNAGVIRRTQSRVRGKPDRGTILAVLAREPWGLRVVDGGVVIELLAGHRGPGRLGDEPSPGDTGTTAGGP